MEVILIDATEIEKNATESMNKLNDATAVTKEMVRIAAEGRALMLRASLICGPEYSYQLGLAIASRLEDTADLIYERSNSDVH